MNITNVRFFYNIQNFYAHLNILYQVLQIKKKKGHFEGVRCFFSPGKIPIEFQLYAREHV